MISTMLWKIKNSYILLKENKCHKHAKCLYCLHGCKVSHFLKTHFLLRKLVYNFFTVTNIQKRTDR